MAATTTNLKSKRHFEILDGLRGVAALSVVTFHFMEDTISDYSKNFIGHGFLAVDFFFCLSGFVIAYAYDDRIGQMGLGKFFKARLIRLHPLVVFGSVLGLITFLFDPFGGSANTYHVGQIALLFLASAFMIPYPVMPDRAFNLFGLNAPAWSLFWEYIANIFYALVLRHLNKWLHLALTIIAAGLLFYICKKAGNTMGGWSGGTFWDGGVRVFYSFLAGMLVYRSQWIIRNRLGFLGMSVLLLAAFLSPFSAWNWITEPFIIILYFPFLIALGAGAIPGKAATKVCNFAGQLSYPIYMVHYAFLWMFYNYYSTHKVSQLQLAEIIVAALVVLSAFAWLVMKVYDTPVRSYLSKLTTKSTTKNS